MISKTLPSWVSSGVYLSLTMHSVIVASLNDYPCGKSSVYLLLWFYYLIHLIAFTLNNSYTWFVSWENSQAGILSQDHPSTWIIDDCHIKWTDSIAHVWQMWVCYGYWIKYTSKLFLLLLNWKKCKRNQHKIWIYIHICNILYSNIS